MEKHLRAESAAIIALSLLLTAVFALSVYMYEGLESEVSDGALSATAEAVRTFFDENEAISAFLGLGGTDGAPQADEKGVTDAAAEYIARYNDIYARLR